MPLCFSRLFPLAVAVFVCRRAAIPRHAEATLKRLSEQPADAGPRTAAAGPDPTTPVSLALIVTEAEAAKLLRLSTRTLQRLRLDGDGPEFVRLTPTGSRLGYTLAALQAWVRQRSVTSTSAATVAAQDGAA